MSTAATTLVATVERHGDALRALPEAGHASGYKIVAEAVDVAIKLTGTPAEEFGEGEVLLLQRGVFGNVAMMVHSAEFPVACATPSAAQRNRLIGAQRQRRLLGAGGVG